MGYTPENNPYIPGDPYSYDLKWIVRKLNSVISSTEAAERAEAAAVTAEAAATTAEQILSTVKSFVYPEMYGAAGDGITDDTAAFQAAVNSGEPVLLLQNKKYLLTDTVTLRSDNDNARLVFALGLNNDRRTANIVCNFADNTRPVFNVMSDGYTFMNVCIDAHNNGSRDLLVFFMRRELVVADYPPDVDFLMFNCHIVYADKVFNFTGRGLTVLCSLFSSCNHIADIIWPGDGADTGTVWHDNATGMRNIRFENNRFHSCGAGGGSAANDWYAFRILSGNAYGFRFVGNAFDRGTCQFIYCAEDIDNWIVTNNTFSGMRGGQAFFDAAGTVNRLIFANNNLTLPDAAASYYVQRVFQIGGYLTNSIISNNTVEVLYNGPFMIVRAFNEDPSTPISQCVISNNIIGSVTDNSTIRGLITVSTHATISRTAICGNIIGSVTGGNLNYGIIRCAGRLVFDYVTMHGNAPNSSYTTDYIINSGRANNCKFDFPIGAELDTVTDTTVGYIPTP